MKPEFDPSQLFDHLPTGVLVLNDASRVLYCNQQAARILGLNTSRLMGQPFLDLELHFVHESGEPLRTEELLKPTGTQNDGKQDKSIIGFQRDADTLLWLAHRIQALVDPQYDTATVLLTLDDVSHVRHAQDQRIAAALEEERSKLIGQFVQSASHEFRTPLSIIQVNLDLLRRSINEDDTKQQKWIEKSSWQVKRLSRLVDMLLTIAELDSWDRLYVAPVKIRDVLHLALANIAGKKQEPPHALSVSIADDLPQIQANDYYLAIALREVISNAIHYTPGTEPIEISAHPLADVVRIIIQDQGMGISQQDLKHIFKRFWRKDQEHSTPGFGLGLPLALRILELHQGTITVESELNKGTRITIDLPTVTEP